MSPGRRGLRNRNTTDLYSNFLYVCCMCNDDVINLYIIASGGCMTMSGRNSSWRKFKAICRNLSEATEGTSGTIIYGLAKIQSSYLPVKYYKVYRFGSLVLREMSSKEYVGVSFIGKKGKAVPLQA
jgi:hypothetical protein